jgi:hypothetical protein
MRAGGHEGLDVGDGAGGAPVFDHLGEADEDGDDGEVNAGDEAGGVAFCCDPRADLPYFPDEIVVHGGGCGAGHGKGPFLLGGLDECM